MEWDISSVITLETKLFLNWMRCATFQRRNARYSFQLSVYVHIRTSVSLCNANKQKCMKLRPVNEVWIRRRSSWQASERLQQSVGTSYFKGPASSVFCPEQYNGTVDEPFRAKMLQNFLRITKRNTIILI